VTTPRHYDVIDRTSLVDTLIAAAVFLGVAVPWWTGVLFLFGIL